MVDFELSTTRENGSIKSRKLNFNGKEYDLTERPILWFGASTVFSIMFISIISSILFIGSKIFFYINNMGVFDNLIDLGIMIIGFCMLLFLLIISLGVIKYIITGNAEPFININIETPSETDDSG